MQISAVRTTGIYCRPGCPARPDPANVEGYHLAASAEAAGYRACQRCRPYRTDDPVELSAPDLVCRAVGLVVDGALDGGTEEQLGARLGVSARHLRRLFDEHVGATPDQLARSRRAHFARRLLDDTDLTVAATAFAAGFGSVRQLNRACHETFRDTPTALRARRRTTDRLVADGGLVLRLPFAVSAGWDAVLATLAAVAVPGVERVTEGAYRRTVVIDGDPGILEVGPGGPDHLLLRAHLPHWEGLIHVVQRTRRVFGPGDRGACPGAWDPFEVGVVALLGGGRRAAAALERLVEHHGAPLPGLAALGLWATFPPPGRLAVADLDAIGLAPTRARAVTGLARAVLDGDVVLDRSVPPDHLVASLRAVPGIGRAPAEYVAARLGYPAPLGRPDNASAPA